MNPIAALAISAAVAGLGVLARALTRSGAVAATLVGTAVVAATGLPGLATLGAYFVGSTVVSRLANLAGDRSDQSETEIRDHRQVLANGGAAAIGALFEWVSPGLGLWLTTIGLAAAASDTWATAFGALSSRPPRDLLTRRPVAPGTSGGVTWLGTLGGVVGAAGVALVAAATTRNWELYLAATVVGFLSMATDSILGSKWQARFWCHECERTTERRRHGCGATTTRRTGLAWLDNNGVNALATAAAVIAGFLLRR